MPAPLSCPFARAPRRSAGRRPVGDRPHKSARQPGAAASISRRVQCALRRRRDGRSAAAARATRLPNGARPFSDRRREILRALPKRMAARPVRRSLAPVTSRSQFRRCRSQCVGGRVADSGGAWPLGMSERPGDVWSRAMRKAASGIVERVSFQRSVRSTPAAVPEAWADASHDHHLAAPRPGACEPA